MSILKKYFLFIVFLTITIFVNDSFSRIRRPKRRNLKRKKRRRKTGSAGAVGSAKELDFNNCKKIPSWKKMKVTLKPEAKLMDLVGWISSITCKKFIVKKNLRAQEVTIYSPTKVTPYEAYKAFLATLETIGLTVQKSGSYYKIIEIANAKGMVHPFLAPGSSIGSTETIVTAMLRVKNGNVEDLAKALGNFKSKYGDITSYAPSNLLIITDLSTSIQRMARMLKHLDVESVDDEKLWVVKIKHGEAADIKDKLSEIFESDGNSGSKSKSTARSRRLRAIIRRRNLRRKGKTAKSSISKVGASAKKVHISKILADERTNTIIIKCDNNAYLQVLSLIKKLDVPLPGGKEKIHIVYLENADADEMAGLLSSITGGSYSGSSRRGSRGRRSSSRRRTSSYRSNRGSTNMEGIFKGPVDVQADISTNSLVIVASAQDFIQLRNIVKKLDKPRRQVFVEVTIMEVSMDKTRDLGVSFHGGSELGQDDTQSFLFGGTVTDSSNNSIMMNPLSLMGFAAGLRGPEIADAESLLGIPGISFPSFGVFFQALQRNNAVNVVSSPHILTTNNEEAEIVVGENVPFQSGISSMASMASADSGSTSGMASMMPMTSIQRQDVALSLKLTPHVNQSDFVRIEVEQELNEVKSIDKVVGPTTSKRKASTVVVVKDQQTVVIGGLMTEKTKNNITKVPLLGDMPILGYLFKSTSKIVEKTNLLIFITPYIIKDESDLRRIFRDKIKQRKEFIDKFGAFEDHEIEKNINYKHKCGLFEEINREANKIESDNTLKKKAMAEYKDVDNSGPVVVGNAEKQRLQKMLNQIKEKKETPQEIKPETDQSDKNKGKDKQ
ncbi:MAG: type II secretion system secretin GspD [Myxococcota bacterium]